MGALDKADNAVKQGVAKGGAAAITAATGQAWLGKIWDTAVIWAWGLIKKAILYLVAGIAFAIAMGICFAVVGAEEASAQNSALGSCSLVGDGSYTVSEASTPNMSIARIIYDVVQQKGGDRVMLVAAFETALVETGMRNQASRANPTSLNFPHDYVTGGDFDSVGVFQQRDSWGTVEERMNPAYAAGKFVDAANGFREKSGDSAGLLAANTQRPRADLRGKYAERESEALALIAQVEGVVLNGNNNPVAGGSNAAAPATVNCAGGQANYAPGATVTVESEGKNYTLTIPQGEVGATLSAAFSQLGVPYSWGGGSNDGPSRGFAQGASTVGFDCSSLLRYALFNGSGGRINAPRTSGPQASYFPANTGDYKPGDILYKPGHVVMYIGPDPETKKPLIVEAPRTGKNVRITTLWFSPTKVVTPTYQ